MGENQKNDDSLSLFKVFLDLGALSEAMLAHLGAMLGDLGAILEQLGDKMWTESAKMSQGPQKTSQSDELSSFFWFSPFLARSRPRSNKGRQDAPKSAPSWQSCPPSWPSWAHLGAKLANLAPSWPILAPRCAPIAIQMEPQMRHKSHLGPSWRQEGHRGPQKCPWSLNFQRFFIEFWTEFDRFLKQLSGTDFANEAQVRAASFGTVAACRA